VVLIDEGKLVMKPIGEDEGAPWARCYGVVPPQTNAMGRETITNYFARLGFRPSKGGRLTYLPELQLVALTDRWFKHDALMEVLRSGGLVPSKIGRWRLVPQTSHGCNLLFLQDTAYGGTWLYHVAHREDGHRSEFFDIVWDDIPAGCGPHTAADGQD
jgi:hypothetical protein